MRLQTLGSMSEVRIPFEALTDQINSAVDVVVQLARHADGALLGLQAVDEGLALGAAGGVDVDAGHGEEAGEQCRAEGEERPVHVSASRVFRASSASVTP
jgi:hypothetical protein